MYSSKGSTQLTSRHLFMPSILDTRPTLLECDFNLHKSNSTYFTDLDIARSHLSGILLSYSAPYSLGAHLWVGATLLLALFLVSFGRRSSRINLGKSGQRLPVGMRNGSIWLTISFPRGLSDLRIICPSPLQVSLLCLDPIWHQKPNWEMRCWRLPSLAWCLRGSTNRLPCRYFRGLWPRAREDSEIKQADISGTKNGRDYIS